MSDNVGFALSPQQANKVAYYANQSKIAVKFTVTGVLAVNQLVSALNTLVGAHEILRTKVVYFSDLGLHLQSLHDNADLAFYAVSAEQLSANGLLHLLDENQDKDEHVASLYVAKVSDTEHCIALACCALNMDVSSLMVLANQLNKAYQGQLVGEDDIIQYPDYAQWQSELLKGDDEDADLNALNHWQQMANNPLSLNTLPLARRSDEPVGQVGDIKRIPVSMAVALSQQVKNQAAQLNIGIDHLLRVAWSIVLGRHNEHSPLMLNNYFDCKMEDLEQSIGLYQKNAPVLVDYDQAMTLAAMANDFSERMNKATGYIDSFDWSDKNYPFGFAFSALSSFSDGLLTWQPSQLEQANGSESLLLQCTSLDGHLSATLCYHSDNYSDADAGLLAAHWGEMVAAICAQSADTLLAQLPMFSAQDKDSLVQFDHVSQGSNDSYISVVARFVQMAKANSQSIGIEAGEQKISYGEIYQKASKVAAALSNNGVKVGDTVGLHMASPTNAVAGMIGIMLLGGVYVPLDITYPLVRLSAMIEDAKLTHVLVERGSDEIEFAVPSIDFDTCLSSDCGLLEAADIPANLPAYMIFTSGSTGRPKGVVVTHNNLDASNQARIRYYQTANCASKFLLLSSFSFDSSIAGLFSTLATGGTLCLVAQNNISALDAVATAIEDMQVTHTLMVPSLYGAMLSEVNSNKLRSLKCVIVAGERCPESLVALHVEQLNQAELVNEYGPTEGTVWATGERLHCKSHTRERVTLGYPIDNTRLYLLDEQLNPVPVGIIGELYLSGQGVAQGYANRADLTAERFLPDLHCQAKRMYRTGDLARYLSDGRVEFVGRADSQVKIRGFRVEIGEIEDVIHNYEGVNGAAVELHGQEQQLICFYTAAGALDHQRLDDFAIKQLPIYMKPAQFVFMDQLPVTPNGKVDRKALQEFDLSVAQVSLVAPQSDTQIKLSGLWHGLLKDQEVGLEHDFFNCGGHSLLAMQLSSRIRDEFDVDVSVQLIFDHSVLAQQAAQIDALIELRDEDLDVYEF